MTLPYRPKKAESMKARPRIGPAAPAKKNRIPSDRYSDMIEGFSRRCGAAEACGVFEAAEVEGIGREVEVEGIWTEEAVVLRVVFSSLFGLVTVAWFADDEGFLKMIGEVDDLPTRGEFGIVEEPDGDGIACV